MFKKILLISLTVVLLTACRSPQSRTSTTTGTTTDTISAPTVTFDDSKKGTTESNIEYCNIDQVSLLLDFYWPATGDAPFPVALYVHGGGWTEGDNTENGEKYIEALTTKGVAVAAVNYRLAPEYQFPAMIEDVKCAVRYVRANATELGIDPDRIGAFGGSAGGHLSLMMGTTGKDGDPKK